MIAGSAGARLVLLLAFVLFFWNLWGTDLAAPDEPYFAEGAREMVSDGAWAVPHVNGSVTTDKPPLFFWLIALCSLPFGVSSFSARLPSALAMLGAVALTLRLGRRLLGERAGVLSGLFFTTNYLVWDKARSSQIDALLCFLILVALSAFEAFRSGERGGLWTGWLFWCAAGLGVLAKGPVGVLLPLGIALVTLCWDRNLGAWRRFAPWTGPLLFALLVLSWMVLATLGGHGEYSVWGAFKEHALGRAIHGMHHRQPPWYYLEVLPVQLLPWTGLVPGALLLAWRRRSAAERFLLVWALFVVAFFTLSTEKRDLYVLPAYPAFLLLAASFATALEKTPAPLGRRWLTRPHAAAQALLILAGMALPIVAERMHVVGIVRAAVLGASLCAAGIVGTREILRGRIAASLLGTALGVALAYLVAATLVQPALDPVRSARSFALALKGHTAHVPRGGILAFRLGNLPEALAFYTSGTYLRETSDASVLAAHLSGSGEAFAVLDERDLALLPEPMRGRLRRVAEAHLNDRPIVLVANP